MQPHDLHQHLVGVGGAVEGAGAGRVIGFGLGLQQLVAADLAFRVELADAAPSRRWQARGHRPAGDEHRGQMPEGERADDQAGHDLVADAEIDGGVEGLVRERDGGGQRDDIAREQRELHAGLALGDAVAHRRHAARHHGHAAGLARGGADQLGEALIRLVGGEHVVIGGDDGEAGAVAGAQLALSPGAQAAKPCAWLAQPSARRCGPWLAAASIRRR